MLPLNSKLYSVWVNKNVSQGLTYIPDCLDHGKVEMHKYVHSILQLEKIMTL